MEAFSERRTPVPFHITSLSQCHQIVTPTVSTTRSVPVYPGVARLDCPQPAHVQHVPRAHRLHQELRLHAKHYKNVLSDSSKFDSTSISL